MCCRKDLDLKNIHTLVLVEIRSFGERQKKLVITQIQRISVLSQSEGTTVR